MACWKHLCEVRIRILNFDLELELVVVVEHGIERIVRIQKASCLRMPGDFDTSAAEPTIFHVCSRSILAFG